MNRKIALLPVDGRPVTRELPKQIASIGGWEVLLPNKELLGFLKEPGKLAELADWIWEIAPEVDGFVFSTDMLGYGGLVPSRINEETEPAIKERMNLLRKLKDTYPEKPLMAFSATMRISNNYVNEEEKEYWKDYGVEIWDYSYHSHRFERTNCPESKQRVDQLQLRIPAAILEDYIETRKKNFQISLSLLEMVEANIVDILVFPQDDTSEYGINIREQDMLSQQVTDRQLFSKVFIYPGADEVGNTLVSRMIYQIEEVEAPTFFPIYSGEKGALSSAMYEDRSINESVKGQIFAFGGYTVSDAGEADIIFAVNVPGKRQGDLALQQFLGEVDTADRNIGEWLKRIQHYIRADKLVALADVAYANGADRALIPRLLHEVSIHKLAGFGAWNTAGNTLGTVVAQAAMVHLQTVRPTLTRFEVQQKLEEQLILRLLDDYVFQSNVRQQVRAVVNEANIDKDDLLRTVKEIFEKESRLFLKRYSLDYPIQGIYLPWDRTFEIGIHRGSSS